jgi:EAL domain-containing protein (putative c-di-GMP-specific phosphodiesterase class I)
VVAEGIENEEQRAQLVDLGCNAGQGFLFSKPVPAERAEELLTAHLAAA